MKTYLTGTLAAIVMLAAWAPAVAEETARVVWICTVVEGKTADDVRAANSAWVKFMQANVDKRITSSILMPVIGNFEGGRFVFADDFPTFDVWNKAREASQTKEGQAIDAALNDVALCSSSSMYAAEKS